MSSDAEVAERSTGKKVRIGGQKVQLFGEIL